MTPNPHKSIIPAPETACLADLLGRRALRTENCAMNVNTSALP